MKDKKLNEYKIFIVDDEPVAREGIALALRKHYAVETFETAEAAIAALKDSPPDLVLLDIGLPGITGLEALVEIKRIQANMLVVMITAFEDVRSIVTAMKSGAHDYVVKPLHMDGLLVCVRNALETIVMRKEIQALHERYLKENLPCFVGESDAIIAVMDMVAKVADSPDTAILIQGETGTGKDLIARAIHYRSPHFQGPLVTMNCAAIPRNLIESELFGYEKGAFSGADAKGKPGLVEKAEGGTLFFDEVGDLSLRAQAKLLRFLESGEYFRVGGTKKRRISTRIVSATNKDLEELIENGEFRKDLYFRLAVIKLEAPSLNKRANDVPLMAKQFLLEFSEKFKKTFTSISPKAEVALAAHNWTGNVRELRNLIERAVLLGAGPILEPKDLGFADPDDSEKTLSRAEFPPFISDGVDLPGLMKKMEKHYFELALKSTEGNESKAARLLNLSRDAFRYRQKKLSD